ncbi:hypothetical protein LJR219_004395 [Phenylobacterium sp. LjRoot219]|uniref:hypothetical protein n=1 Tax=Phenylobacterium sp. LjRoot219 TaxID=3342283 RepID=UPI003ED029C2
MNAILRTCALAVASLFLATCATATGAAVGAGIGSLSGDAGKGAVIGGSVGAVIDIID